MKKIFCAAAMVLSFGIVSAAWAIVGGGDGPVPAESLPEPSLLLLLGAGFIGVAALGRKLKR